MKRLLSLLAFAMLSLSVLADDTEAFAILLTNGQTCLAPTERISQVYFSDDGQTMFVVHDADVFSFATNQISQLSYSALPTAVSIDYDGQAATIVNPHYFDGVSIQTEGAFVTVTSTADDEVEYVLSGTSPNGNFKIYSAKKYQITMKGLQLTNPLGPAINSQSKKKGEIKSQRGFVNTLTDGTDYAESPNGEDQKGCIFSEGQLIFKGAGQLVVDGRHKHAIASDDYIRIENSTITLSTTASDCSAINANDSIIVSGGTIAITTLGNAAKGLKTKGNIDISGGSISVTQDGGVIIENGDPSYTTAIKANGRVSIVGGDITILNRADGGKGISADGTIDIADGTLNITTAGAPGTYDPTATGQEPEPDLGPSYKVYVALPNTGTYWTAVYLYTDAGQRVATLTDAVEVTPASGAKRTFFVYDFQQPTTGSYHFRSDNYQNSQGGPGGRPGGGSTSYTIRSTSFNAPTSGNSVFYTIATNYSTSGATRTFTLTDATSSYANGQMVAASTGDKPFAAACITSDSDVTISGATLTLTASGNESKAIKSDGTVTLNAGQIEAICSGNSAVVNRNAVYCTAVKADNFVGNGGSLNVTASGAASRGISVDNNLYINNGLYTIACTGAGASYTNTSNKTDSYAACAYKADGNLAILGGTHTLTNSGKGGKGIKVGGQATFGATGEEGPAMTIQTTGANISSGLGSAKAVKVQGEIVVHSGRYLITTTQTGGEGMESKTSISLNGGKFDITCADDGINCSGPIVFNGAYVSVVSTGNDAVDSNYGRTGAIQIKDGAVFAYSTKGGAEEGLDCDNNSYITVSGGIAVSAGGNQGGGGGWGGSSSSGSIGSATQGYALVTTSTSYSAGRYYTLQDASGQNIVTFAFSKAVNSSLSLFTAPQMTAGSTYYVKYNTSEPADAQVHIGGLYLGSSQSGGTQTTSFTAK